MVLPRAFLQREQFAAAVAEIERQLDPHVVRIRYSLGDDWSGEPAVFFRIVLPDAATRRDLLLESANRVSDAIERQIEPMEEWGVLPYFSFRSQSEQEQLNEPAWA
jgi:hypothetical protein